MARRIVVEIFDTQILRAPSLICGFPGSGFVEKIVDHMVEELKAIPFANMLVPEGESLPGAQHNKKLGYVI